MKFIYRIIIAFILALAAFVQMATAQPGGSTTIITDQDWFLVDDVDSTGYMESINLPSPAYYDYPVEVVAFSSEETFVSNLSDNPVRLSGTEFKISPDIEKLPATFVLPGLSTAVCRYTQHFFGDATRLELNCIDFQTQKHLEKL